MESSEEHSIVQCPSCETKFAVKRALLAGIENPKFHCSRCDNVFAVSLEEEASAESAPIPEAQFEASTSEAQSAQNEFTEGEFDNAPHEQMSWGSDAIESPFAQEASELNNEETLADPEPPAEGEPTLDEVFSEQPYLGEEDESANAFASPDDEEFQRESVKEILIPKPEEHEAQAHDSEQPYAAAESLVEQEDIAEQESLPEEHSQPTEIPIPTQSTFDFSDTPSTEELANQTRSQMLEREDQPGETFIDFSEEEEDEVSGDEVVYTFGADDFPEEEPAPTEKEAVEEDLSASEEISESQVDNSELEAETKLKDLDSTEAESRRSILSSEGTEEKETEEESPALEAATEEQETDGSASEGEEEEGSSDSRSFESLLASEEETPEELSKTSPEEKPEQEEGTQELSSRTAPQVETFKHPDESNKTRLSEFAETAFGEDMESRNEAEEESPTIEFGDTSLDMGDQPKETEPPLAGEERGDTTIISPEIAAQTVTQSSPNPLLLFSTPMFGFFLLILLGGYVEGAPKIIASTVASSFFPEMREAAPEGLRISEESMQQVSLVNGDRAFVIKGQIRNDSPFKLSKIVVEGLLFQADGEVLKQEKSESASNLSKTKISNMTPAMVTEMQVAGRSLNLAPGEKKEIAVVIVADPAVPPSFYSFRVYSVVKS